MFGDYAWMQRNFVLPEPRGIAFRNTRLDRAEPAERRRAGGTRGLEGGNMAPSLRFKESRLVDSVPSAAMEFALQIRCSR